MDFTPTVGQKTVENKELTVSGSFIVLCKGWKGNKNVYIIHSLGQTNLDEGTTGRDEETKHLLLNASRLQCDMFAVLSSSDVWPTVIHFKHLACAAPALIPRLSLLCSAELQDW